MEKISNSNVAIYLRLSREDEEDKESQSIGNQRKIINDFIENNAQKENFNVIGEYVDDGFTGSNFDRPDFKRMIKDIEKGIINVVITKDLSRFGRDHINSGYYLESYFPEKNVRYIAITDNLDTFDDDTLDMIQFKMSFNDYYPRDISKKIKKVKRMKAEKGEYQAGQAPYRIQKVQDNKK